MIESADDLASFFDADAFGEMLVFEGIGRLAAIWDRPTGDVELPNGRSVVVDAHIVHLPALIPATDGTPPVPFVPMKHQRFAVEADGKVWRIVGQPRRDRSGWTWRCEVEEV